MHVLAADRHFLVLVFLNFDFQSIGCRYPALVQSAGGARFEGNACRLPFGDGLLDVRDGEPDVVHHRSDRAAGRRRRVGPLIENDQDAGELDPLTGPDGDTAHGEKDMLVGRDVARIEMPVPVCHARVVGSIGLCPCGARRESGYEPQSRDQFLHGFLPVDHAPRARDLREPSTRSAFCEIRIAPQRQLPAYTNCAMRCDLARRGPFEHRQISSCAVDARLRRPNGTFGRSGECTIARPRSSGLASDPVPPINGAPRRSTCAAATPTLTAPAYFSSAAMRASNGGCVENRLSMLDEIIMA